MKLRTMVNTRNGMVSVFDQSVIDERPWYEEIVESVIEPSGNETPVEPGRKLHWKTALKLKAAQIKEEQAAQSDVI